MHQGWMHLCSVTTSSSLATESSLGYFADVADVTRINLGFKS